MNLKLLLPTTAGGYSLLFLLVTLFLPLAGKSQSEVDQLLAEAFKKLENQKGATQEKMSFLLHGKIHYVAEPLAKGSPFFPFEQWTDGNIHTTNFTFQNVPIKYDAFLDRLVYLDTSSTSLAIALNPADILGFDILGKKFISLKDEISSKPEGYYEVLYTGNTTLYQKHQSKIQKSGDDPYGKFIFKQKFFLQKGNQLYPLRKKKDFLKVFPTQQDELKSFIKSNDFSFRNVSPERMVSLLTHFDPS